MAVALEPGRSFNGWDKHRARFHPTALLVTAAFLAVAVGGCTDPGPGAARASSQRSSSSATDGANSASPSGSPARGASGSAGATLPRASSTNPADSPQGAATVVYVVDGDTIDVDLNGSEQRVRLLQIDTPETVDKNRPTMCFGKEASDRLRSLLPVGAPIHLVRDQELRDDFGRLLAYVYRDVDGLFVNLDQARGGFATALVIKPNTAHASEIRAAVAEAKSNKRGAWAACPAPFEQ